MIASIHLFGQSLPILLHKKFWKYFLPLFFISFFYKPLMLLFLVMYIYYNMLLILFNKLRFNTITLIYILFLIIVNGIVSYYINGTLKFLLNELLFFIFISPLILFLLLNFSVKNSCNLDISIYKYKEIKLFKLAIETYLFIEIFFSFLSGFKRAIEYNFVLDVDFGDIIAGTFRIPLIYTPDSANVTFTFTMILTLSLYIIFFKRSVNKFIVTLSIFTIFLASVNHLILIVLFSLLISILWRYPLKVLLFMITIIFLYANLQPTNFNLIIERLIIIFSNIFSLEDISNISLKGKYIYNFINDFKDNFLQFFLFGVGGGSYSSRSALFFTGEYVSSFPFKNISYFMANNTYILWQELLVSPPWLAGAFNYPYGSLFSFIAEIGLINTFIIFFLFYKQLKKTNIFTFSQRLFIILIIILAGLVDNYYEYFQSTFIFYYLIYNFYKIKIRLISNVH